MAFHPELIRDAGEVNKGRVAHLHEVAEPVEFKRAPELSGGHLLGAVELPGNVVQTAVPDRLEIIIFETVEDDGVRAR